VKVKKLTAEIAL